jgi:hypothetical protein
MPYKHKKDRNQACARWRKKHPEYMAKYGRRYYKKVTRPKVLEAQANKPTPKIDPIARIWETTLTSRVPRKRTYTENLLQS